jgi:hypothetical protein
VATDEIPRDEAEAALDTRRELGRDYEPAIVDSFVDRLDKVIQQRVDEAVAKQGSAQDATAAAIKAKANLEKSHASYRLALIIVSMGAGIPLTGIAGHYMGPSGIMLVWTAIVLLNVVFSLGNRGSRRLD